MQVFLPYADFHQATVCLDKSRLGNQVYREGLTLLRGGWPNHPASKMWLNYGGKDYRYSLCEYLLAGLAALELRDKFYPAIKAEILLEQQKYPNIGRPEWLGDEKVHSSHRSRLLFKGRVDAACAKLKKLIGRIKVKDWLLNNGYPEKTYFKHSDILKLEEFLSDKPTEPISNWYEQFGWGEKDNLDYFWPSKELTFVKQ